MSIRRTPPAAERSAEDAALRARIREQPQIQIGPGQLKPRRNVMVFRAVGADARAQAEAALTAAGLRISSWLKRPVDDACGVLVHLPSRPDQRRAVEATVKRIARALARRGLATGANLAVDSDGGVLAVAGTIVARFRDGVTRRKIAGIAARYGCVVKRKLPYLDGAYVLRWTRTQSYELLGTAERLGRHADVAYAFADTVRVTTTHGGPDDFLFPEQAELRTIGCSEAWSLMPTDRGYGSAEVVVAVIDPDGVFAEHPDIAANVIGAASFDPSGAVASSHHGTQCAVAAVGKPGLGSGIVGVAGGCRLLIVRIPRMIDAVTLVDALAWAAGFDPRTRALAKPKAPADVISCSFSARFVTPGDQRLIDDALGMLTTRGRGGKGCVVCVSAGNDGVEIDPTLALAASAKVVTVGASYAEAPTTYSNWGAAVDLVAPSSRGLPTDGDSRPTMVAMQPGSGAWVGAGAWPSARQYATTLARDAAVGAKTIEVVRAVGFQAGRRVLLGAPGQRDCEAVVVEAIKGRTLTLTGPTRFKHRRTTAAVTSDRANHSRAGHGTSFATPLVAGAAALVLSAAPALRWDQVREVLRTTAVAIAPGEVWSNPAMPAGVRKTYGAGRLNVKAAISRVRTPVK